MNPRRRIEWVRGEQQLLPSLARRVGVDVLHRLASAAPGWGSFRRVATVHDLIYRPVSAPHPGPRSLGMRVLVPLAARRSDRIILDAASTCDELQRFLRIPPQKVDVVGTVARTSSRRRDRVARRPRRGRAADRAQRLGQAGRQEPRAADRRAGADPRRAPTALVLPGYPTAYEEVLRQRVAELGVSAAVRLLGWIWQKRSSRAAQRRRLLRVPIARRGSVCPCSRRWLATFRSRAPGAAPWPRSRRCGAVVRPRARKRDRGGDRTPPERPGRSRPAANRGSQASVTLQLASDRSRKARQLRARAPLAHAAHLGIAGAVV